MRKPRTCMRFTSDQGRSSLYVLICEICMPIIANVAKQYALINVFALNNAKMRYVDIGKDLACEMT